MIFTVINISAVHDLSRSCRPISDSLNPYSFAAPGICLTFPWYWNDQFCAAYSPSRSLCSISFIRSSTSFSLFTLLFNIPQLIFRGNQQKSPSPTTSSPATPTLSFDKSSFCAFFNLFHIEGVKETFTVSELSTFEKSCDGLSLSLVRQQLLSNCCWNKKGRFVHFRAQRRQQGIFSPARRTRNCRSLELSRSARCYTAHWPCQGIAIRMPTRPICLTSCSDRRDVQYHTSKAVRIPNCHLRRKFWSLYEGVGIWFRAL